jgi:transcriptional regulator with XRE-family HTH domain
MRYIKKQSPKRRSQTARGAAARLLRDARLDAGLTQVQLARRAGVSQPVIAAYEAGSREPSVPMLSRLVEATGRKLVMRYEPDRAIYRLCDTARDIAKTRDDATKLLLVFEFLRSAQDDGASVAELVTPTPPPTGDARFDAMLAAVAEHLCRTTKRRPPRWVFSPDRYLDTPWWVSTLGSAQRRAHANAPMPFRRRGVMIDRHDLVSV